MRFLLWFSIAAFAALPALAEARPCTDAAYRELDFWIGRWNVFDSVTGTKEGTSDIEKILAGCAIAVDWHEADGSGEVREIFRYDPAAKMWRQLWMSDRGGTKERHSLDTLPDGTIRFIGEVPEQGGGSHLDRSSVTPLPQHEIHQRIEISHDGVKWETAFDAVYRLVVSASR